MLEAIYLDIDFSSWVDVQDIAAYTFLLFVGVRIGHVAVDAQRAHALRFEDIGFYPSFDDCVFVYFHFRSTKTRPRAADTPYWSSVRAQPHLLLCPVAMLKRIFALNFRGIHTDFVFHATWKLFGAQIRNLGCQTHARQQKWLLWVRGWPPRPSADQNRDHAVQLYSCTGTGVGPLDLAY